MGTYRSSYPMISDEIQGTSSPHFAWFHPGNYMGAMRNGINPFQGSQHNTEEITVIPNTLNPIVYTPVAIEPEAEPTKPTKKLKTSRNNPKEGAPKEPKPKSYKKRGRKSTNLATNESGVEGDMVLSPFCSCTGVPRQCYRWGSGGWQSACCTTNISEYPLPMSETRPGSRTAGRKMSHGAFVKLLGRLASEGYDLTSALDLKDHWARHGTNKFVILK